MTVLGPRAGVTAPRAKTPRRRRTRDGVSGFFSFTVASTLFAVMMMGAFGGWSAPKASVTTEAAALTELPAAFTGLIDVDGDGLADFANPTMGPMRGVDAYGSGEFHADRDGGKRVHEGADYVAAPNATIYAPITGIVTKIGYAYAKQTTLTFVELTNQATALVSRVLYVDPSVTVGQQVEAGKPIGFAENLQKRYRGITNHVHVQITANRMYLDPANLLPKPPPLIASLPAPAQVANGRVTGQIAGEDDAMVIKTTF
jgi:murein DD-endopeptidase MepM/ murein hydrolase activator NlpD